MGGKKLQALVDNIYKEVTSGKGGVTGVLLPEPECKKYAQVDNSYGYGMNIVNPKGCIKSGNQVRYSTGDAMNCSQPNTCIEKERPPPSTWKAGGSCPVGCKEPICVDGNCSDDIINSNTYNE